jgi:hypothetical protein
MTHRGNSDGGVFRLGANRLLGHHILFLLRAVGPPRKLTPHQAREALKRVAACEPMREIAFLRIDHSTIPRLKARSAAEV